MDLSRVSVARLLAIIWAAQIFWMSTSTFKSEHSKALLTRLVELLHLRLSVEELWTLNTILRKCAHVVEYAILSILLYFSFRGTDRLRHQPNVARWSILIACVYALADEFHQAFVRDRGASLIDCSLDFIGAVVGAFLVFACLRVLREEPIPGQSG